MTVDDEQHRQLEADYREAKREFEAKMDEYFPERGKRRQPMTDDEAIASLQQYAAREYELRVPYMSLEADRPAPPNWQSNLHTSGSSGFRLAEHPQTVTSGWAARCMCERGVAVPRNG